MPDDRRIDTSASPATAQSAESRLLWLWLVFCVVKVGGAVLLYALNERNAALWKPALWEGSSMFVGSLTIALHWYVTRATRDEIERPWYWLWHHLRWLPLWWVLFTPLTYGIRIAVYTALGLVYEHAEWSGVFLYESMQYGLFFLLWLGIVFAFLGQQRLGDELRQRERAETALREASLALLRQQLQPHFLFNSLNLISATMYEDVPKADHLLRNLANLLRQSVASTTQAMHPLREEIKLLRAYAEIMAARFEGRVDIEWAIDAASERCLVPAMITQPLLENVFKHCVEPGGGRVVIGIAASLDGSHDCSVRIRQSHGQYAPHEDMSGHGLANVRARLVAHYEVRGSLLIENLTPTGVCVTLTIPCAY